MYLVRLKIVGNCCIPDLNDFMIYSGNDKIIDLEELFTAEQIKRSLQSPKGCLRQMIDAGIVETVNQTSIDYKMQKRIEKQNENITNKKTTKQIMKELNSLPVSESVNKIETEYFDNLSVLDKLMSDTNNPKQIREIAKKCMNENLNQELDKRFVLI